MISLTRMVRVRGAAPRQVAPVVRTTRAAASAAHGYVARPVGQPGGVLAGVICRRARGDSSPGAYQTGDGAGAGGETATGRGGLPEPAPPSRRQVDGPGRSDLAVCSSGKRSSIWSLASVELRPVSVAMRHGAGRPAARAMLDPPAGPSAVAASSASTGLVLRRQVLVALAMMPLPAPGRRGSRTAGAAAAPS